MAELSNNKKKHHKKKGGSKGIIACKLFDFRDRYYFQPPTHHQLNRPMMDGLMMVVINLQLQQSVGLQQIISIKLFKTPLERISVTLHLNTVKFMETVDQFHLLLLIILQSIHLVTTSCVNRIQMSIHLESYLRKLSALPQYRCRIAVLQVISKSMLFLITYFI